MQNIRQRYGNNPRVAQAQRIANRYNDNMRNAYNRREMQRSGMSADEFNEATNEMDSRSAARYERNLRNSRFERNDYAGQAAKGSSVG